MLLLLSLCKGFSIKKITLKNYILVGIYFGSFQAFMPLIGFFIGKTFVDFISFIDHYIIFALLVYLGYKMIKESFNDEEDNKKLNKFDFRSMIILAFATSIDALGIGINFAFLKINLILAISMIGLITFILCILALKLGNKFGSKYKNKAELTGGIILILLGFKILLNIYFFKYLFLCLLEHDQNQKYHLL